VEEGVIARALAPALAAVLLCFSTSAEARPRVTTKKRPAKQAARGEDPSRWFATRAGLIRVYQMKARGKAGGEGRSGASCEVVDSRPAAEGAAAHTLELCTIIVSKKPKRADQLTYELRSSGIFMVAVEQVGTKKPVKMERLLLPGNLRVGASWKEPRGQSVFDRRIKAAGAPCKAAGFKFGDCLVVAVVQRTGGRVARRFTETYAAGVGLVEDSQVQLVDLKGL
jgi:hypothetical protein